MTLASENFEGDVFHRMYIRSDSPHFNFSRLSKVCKNLQVDVNSPKDEIRLSWDNSIRTASMANLYDMLKLDNPEVDIQFSEDMLNFSPDEELISKSSMPLWVLKMVSPTSMSLCRITESD